MGEYDIHISGGTIVDGTRVPRRRGDLWIKDGRIAQIGGRADGVVRPGDRRRPARSSPRASSTATPTTTPRSAGTRGARSPAGTASRPSCSATAASASRPCKPDFRERSMLTMTRTEAIPYESMREGMPWDWETIPEYLDSLDRAPKGVNVIQYMPTASLMTYVMGLEAAKIAPGHRRRSARRCSACCTRAWTPASPASRSSASAPNSVQADFDGSPMVTDTMVDEDILALAEVLAERDEGFDPDHPGRPAACKADYAFLERLAEVAQRPVLYNVVDRRRATNAEVHRKPLRWVEKCREQGPADLRPVRHRSRRLRLHARALEPLRRLPGVARRHHRHARTRSSRRCAIPSCARRSSTRPRRPTGGCRSSRPASAATRPRLVIQGVNRQQDLQQYVGRSVGEIAEERGQAPHRGDARPVARRRPQRRVPRPGHAAPTPSSWPR